MSFQPKMVDRATGASPPWSTTREMASSPINFDSSIQMATSDDFRDCSTTITQGRNSAPEIIVTNKVMNKQLISSFPSPITSESNNTSPLLSSIASNKPMPLMSIGIQDSYGINSISSSPATLNNMNKENVNNRYWPIDHHNQYDIRNHQKRTRNNRRYKTHRHQHQVYCRRCVRGPQMTTSVDYHRKNKHLGNNQTYCTHHDCCL